MKLSKKQKELLAYVFQQFYKQGLNPESDVMCLDHSSVARSLIEQGIFQTISSDTDMLIVKIGSNLPRWAEDMKIMAGLVK